MCAMESARRRAGWTIVSLTLLWVTISLTRQFTSLGGSNLTTPRSRASHDQTAERYRPRIQGVFIPFGGYQVHWVDPDGPGARLWGATGPAGLAAGDVITHVHP